MWLLLKKQTLDIKNKILLYLALFFIVLVGMIFYSGFTSAQNNILNSINKFYESANLADYTIKSPTTFNEDELNNFLSKIDGKYDIVYNEMSYGTTNYFYHRNTFNTNNIELVEGTFSKGQHDIVLDYDYAITNGYFVNDYIIINNNAYHITGLAKFPNHVFKGNYFPDLSSSFIALKYEDTITTSNIIFLDTNMSLETINELVSTCFSDEYLSITYKTLDYGYQRVENDLALVNSILFIFPLACFISIVIILFINYNKIIDEQKPYIGILKANGFKTSLIYISLLIIPIILVLVAALIGSCIGVNTIPNLYTRIIDNYYALPSISNSNIVLSVIVPIIVLLITTILTISIPIILTIKQQPVDLLKTKAESKFGRSFLRKVKISYHVKLIIRNIITSKRKNICLTIAASLLLGIVLAVFFISDSLAYTDNDLAKETYKGDFVLDIDDLDKVLESNLIEDTYFYFTISIKTEARPTSESLYIFDSEKPSISLKDTSRNILDLTKDGIFLPSDYQKYGYQVGDTIKIYPAQYGYGREIEVKIADFFEEIGVFKFAISIDSLVNAYPQLGNYVQTIKDSIPPMVKLNDGSTIDDINNYIHDNFIYQANVNEVSIENDETIKKVSNLYTVNTNLTNTNLSDFNINREYKYNTKQMIILDDNLTIMNLSISEIDLRPNMATNGVYLPVSYKDMVKDNKIVVYIDKKSFTFDVIGYVDGNSCYTTFDYLDSIKDYNHNYSYSYYYEITDTSKIEDLKNYITNNNVYSNYTITTFNTFGERLNIINDLLNITKVIATILASIIFVLLVYNIGVIGLTNRLADIKVFKTAGLKNAKLKHMLSIENILVVIIASAISVPIGISIATSILNDIYEIASVRMVLSLDVLSIFVIIFIAIILIIITSFLINKKIEKLNLAKLLKGE